jgi:phosphoribosyl 1,2-cyclic phosphodiesterase
MFNIQFWGVRGSIATANSRNIGYGGNTSCICVHAGERVLIFDAGTGFPPLGTALIAEAVAKAGAQVVTADIFFSHTHLDHTSGFTMFPPFLNAKNTFCIHGPLMASGKRIKTGLLRLFNKDFWPINVDQLPARLKWKSIGETRLSLGRSVVVRSIFLTHPCPCLGYRIDYKGKSIALLYDNELKSDSANDRVVDFMRDADVAVLDASYTKAEYETRKGWGHSSYEAAFDAATKAGAKTLVFFHHDPTRDDAALAAIEEEYAAKSKKMKVMAAKENMVIELHE